MGYHLQAHICYPVAAIDHQYVEQLSCLAAPVSPKTPASGRKRFLTQHSVNRPQILGQTSRNPRFSHKRVVLRAEKRGQQAYLPSAGQKLLNWPRGRAGKSREMSNLDDIIKEASGHAEALPQDVFFYNGSMQTGRDLDCIQIVQSNRQRDECLLLLTTDGGDPDAAYKISRCLQDRYKKFSALISGRCKSAGTLLAIGAHELVFTPYGELGPLDIQLTKVDRFDQLQSGLTISDSLNTLEERAVDRFYRMVRDYIQQNQGLLSFASATKAASDFVTQLYAPVFSRIDPEEIGARARSMRIATDYGRRLAARSQNIRPNTLKQLSETYSSHSFVIDRQEAGTLFLRVRDASDAEIKVVTALGNYARFEQHLPGSSHIFRVLSKPKASSETKKEASNGQTDERGHPPPNGGDSAGSDGAPQPTPRRKKPSRNRSISARRPAVSGTA